MIHPVRSLVTQSVADHATAHAFDRVHEATEDRHKFQKLLDHLNAAGKPEKRTSLLTAPSQESKADALSKQGLSDMTAAQLSKHVDNFLKLLMANLKHQDPMNPMEATDFTSHLVQFTGVEQQIVMNKKLESIFQLQKHGQDLGASYLLDRTVQVPGDTMPFDGGRLEMAFDVPAHLQQGYLVIKDTTGHIVHIKDVTSTGGRQKYIWNGQRDDGAQAEQGYYTAQVIAANASGEAETVAVSMLGKVTGVYFENGEAQLVVAGQTINADRVQAIHL